MLHNKRRQIGANEFKTSKLPENHESIETIKETLINKRDPVKCELCGEYFEKRRKKYSYEQKTLD
ncbi:hypothetical protein BpHYR1_012737 [Brachionus plicatilis]|uniref:C2H2-type domain-containing protein n=1 Tax=Brachionus plicatilis TaxID=10195 RepID=A0A3M7T1W8_BRAPC|nr:hypothetical protein BpHYR1_012737 [Brachionus plicatilis]